MQNTRKTVLLTSLLLLSAAGAAFALQKPTRAQLETYEQDGTLAARQAFARSLGTNRFAPGAVARFKRDRQLKALLGRGLAPAAAAAQLPPADWGGMPVTGTPKVLVLLIEFGDYAHTNSSTTVNTQVFGAGVGGPPAESLKNFYSRSSYGLLTITGNTLGWYNTTLPRGNIPETVAGREALIKQALNYYDGIGHDFSQYDNDGDGAVDYFAVIWTGPDNGWGNFWWGYQTTFQDTAYKLDAKSFGTYSWQWESNPVGGAYDPLVLIHETGHALGLPDYYDYEPLVGNAGGVGGLDMMDGNWGDHNAFSKFMLGWLDPVTVSAGADSGTLRPSDANPDAIKLMPEAEAGQIFGEYFIAQNRDQAGNDLTIPASGLLIWHVDSRLNAGGTDFIYDNSVTDHKLLRLMEADGLEEIDTGAFADAGDFYAGASAFGPGTSPNSAKHDGSYTGVSLGNIGGTPASTTFDYSVLNAAKLVTVTDNLFRPLKGGTCKLDVTALKAGNLSIKIYTSAGALIKTLYNGPVAAGPATYNWAGDTDGGRTAASGVYIVQVRGPGVGKTLKVVLIK